MNVGVLGVLILTIIWSFLWMNIAVYGGSIHFELRRRLGNWRKVLNGRGKRV